tara:strand:- start:4736 stop:5353 length:618 start_codon:yes stop_codon:yes gene_type:complete
LKKEINIYTNIQNYKFFQQIIPEYIFNFKTIDELSSYKSIDDKGGVIINKTIDDIGIDINELRENYIIFTCDQKTKQYNNNIRIFKAPLFPHQFKSNIDSFLNNNSIQVGDLIIFNQKLENSINGKYILLTEIENKILIYLIKNKYSTKEIIKENILNIKSTIETNSVESHLTRIRKKINSIESKIKIKSKQNIISLDFSLKNLD